MHDLAELLCKPLRFAVIDVSYQSALANDTSCDFLGFTQMDIEQSVLAQNSRSHLVISAVNGTSGSDEQAMMQSIAYVPIIIRFATNQWLLKSNRDIFAT
jgi:hypothetical protein